MSDDPLLTEDLMAQRSGNRRLTILPRLGVEEDRSGSMGQDGVEREPVVLPPKGRTVTKLILTNGAPPEKT